MCVLEGVACVYESVCVCLNERESREGVKWMCVCVCKRVRVCVFMCV